MDGREREETDESVDRNIDKVKDRWRPVCRCFFPAPMSLIVACHPWRPLLRHPTCILASWIQPSGIRALFSLQRLAATLPSHSVILRHSSCYLPSNRQESGAGRYCLLCRLRRHSLSYYPMPATTLWFSLVLVSRATQWHSTPTWSSGPVKRGHTR
jgi:hypothetical protein